MEIVTEEFYPLSKKKTVKGTRRLAREKVLQILVAYDVCELQVEKLYEHIFYRDFNFEAKESKNKDKKVLTNEEIYELEADTPIIWKEKELTFSKKLIAVTLENKEFIYNIIKNTVNNYEINRIDPIDKILMLMSVAEIISFPDIPTKVSINEAIDIAKLYSTDKSSQFINGMLDRIVVMLKKENKIFKEGTGLIDHT